MENGDEMDRKDISDKVRIERSPAARCGHDMRMAAWTSSWIQVVERQLSRSSQFFQESVSNLGACLQRFDSGRCEERAWR